MSSFLEKAAEAARSNVAGWKTRYPEPAKMPRHPVPPFLPEGGSECSIIAEVKVKSPSRGELMGEKDPLCLSTVYESCGAGAVSVVVEEQYFGGSPELFVEVGETTALPLLWKDFVVDTYQIGLAAGLGASAVLLIAGMLTDVELISFLKASRDAKLRPLVEVHNARELDRAVDAGADLVGINNRNLVTLEVDTAVSESLALRLPPGIRAVSESGIRTAQDVVRMAVLGYRAVLVGESLVTAEHPDMLLKEMVKAGRGRDS